MKIIPKSILFLLMGLSLIQAQSGQTGFSLTANTSKNDVFRKDTLRILAIMVEFQADKYDATVGTGKFGSHYTKNYQDTIIDPLPHNAAYFDDHLEFAKNYFRKVSNGKLNVKYKTLPDVITVSKMMRDYCPSYKSTDFTPLGNLSKEAWTLAYQQNPSFNFADYDLFIIFHAGVSNSWNTGSIEINRNLPALFLGETALKGIYGNTFSGLINNTIINNSIIMPESESRETKNINDTITFDQISINGVLIANIVSYLGLPDLFNTATGYSAIGRFGLMDSQGMFANMGIFPPEPSAWEKVYLGWETPVVASIKNIKATISARGAAGISDTTILKIPINDYEYYLVENRQQDVFKDGIKITYKRNNTLYTQVLQPDTSGLFTFYPSNIKGGVVVDVDEFDAAVPGNGIVIWHVDENIINQKISSNSINNDKLKKGVAVVEADGINDIGEIVKTVFGDVVGEGSYEDFWFSGNKIKYYKNKFADDTKPSAKANNGSNSFITMQNFSTSTSKMSFNLSFGGTVEQKLAVKLDLTKSPESVVTVKVGNDIINFILVDGSLLKLDSNGKQLAGYPGFSSFKPVYYVKNDSSFIAGASGNKLNILSIIGNRLKTISFQRAITAPPVLHYNSNNQAEILLGNETGNIYAVSDNSIATLEYALNGKIIQICSVQDHISAVAENYFSDVINNRVALTYKVKSAALSKDKNGNYITIMLAEGNRFIVASGNNVISEFRINESGEIKKFILADIANSGENSIVFTVNDKLYAVSSKGIVVDNYPISLIDGNTFLPVVLSLNYDSDKITDFVTFTSSGDIYFINGKTARIAKEMSLSTGSKVLFANLHAIADASQASLTDNLSLSVITEKNMLYEWDLQFSSAKKIWQSEYSDYNNSSFIPQSVNAVVYENLLPEGKVYNWPNPVYGNETNIRFYVNEDSKVNIKIFDMGGQIAAEFQKDASGNIDNEVVWNVAGIKSGVYFAHVEAVSKSGKTEHKIVKIAVIK